MQSRRLCLLRCLRCVLSRRERVKGPGPVKINILKKENKMPAGVGNIVYVLAAGIYIISFIIAIILVIIIKVFG